MKILRNYVDNNIVINTETDIQTNAGWEENLQEFETEVLKEIINPIENYETIRYIHAPYSTTKNGLTFQQVDLWFEFYFLSGGTYSTDYTAAGITLNENTKFLTQFNKSFFRIEFYKTPGTVTNNVLTCEPPTRINRKMVFAKNLPTTLSEKFHLNSVADTIHIPIFHASNYKNREMIYQFWFQDESVLAETNLSGTTTGNTFFMTAKFYNTKDGSIVDFTNTDLLTSQEVTEQNHLYYQVDFDYVNHTYSIYRYNGTTKGTRIGESGDPIMFYQKGGKIPTTPTPTPTPTVTRSGGVAVTPTPTTTSSPPAVGGSPTPTPTVTTTNTPTPSPVYYWFELTRCDDGTTKCYSTPKPSGALVPGRVFWSSGGHYYTIGAYYNTTGADPGNGACSDKLDGSMLDVGKTCYDTTETPIPQVTYRTAHIAGLFRYSGYTSYTDIQTHMCGKDPSQMYPNITQNTGAYLDASITAVTPGVLYDLYSDNIDGSPKWTGSGSYWWGAIVFNTHSQVDYIVRIENGAITEWRDCSTGNIITS